MLELREGDDAEWNRSRRVPHWGTYNATAPSAAAAGIDGAAVDRRGGEETERADAACVRRSCAGLNALFAERLGGRARRGASPRCGTSTSASRTARASTARACRAPPVSSGTRPSEPPGRARRAWSVRSSRRCSTRGVDLMGTGGMVSSAHGEAEIGRDHRGLPRAAIGDLRAESLLE